MGIHRELLDAIEDLLSYYSNLKEGEKDVSVAGTPEKLVASATERRCVIVKAKKANTGLIYVGSSTMSGGVGLELDSGEHTILLVDDASKIFIDAEVSGEGVTYLMLW